LRAPGVKVTPHCAHHPHQLGKAEVEYLDSSFVAHHDVARLQENNENVKRWIDRFVISLNKQIEREKIMEERDGF